MVASESTGEKQRIFSKFIDIMPQLSHVEKMREKALTILIVVMFFRL